MNLRRRMRRGPLVLLVIAVFLFTVSCGTILHPERRGQPAGRIDAAVAVLDGLGLIFYVIPGVVAFAVDFATGAIYLPSGSAAIDAPPDPARAKIVQTGPRPLTRARIETIVAQATGRSVDLASPDLLVARADAGGDLDWTPAAD